MATFEVTAEQVTIHPHPGADRLDLAQVGLYRTVVAKGQWKTGDVAFYIPEYAVLPEDIITHLGLEGKLAGSAKNRVKPVKLRGELSQGLLLPLDYLDTDEEIVAGKDYAEALGIVKWQPEIPATMAGDVEGAYDFIPWIDIENIQKFPDLFTEGEEVVITEKVHGTLTQFTVVSPGTENEVVQVTSKGLGEKRLILKEDDRVLYWRAVRGYGLVEAAQRVAQNFENVTKVAFFGETFGSRVQDLHYGFKEGTPGYLLFDIAIEQATDAGHIVRWLNPDEFKDAAAVAQVATVPVYYTGPFNIDIVREHATGREQVSGKELHIREGVVVRSINRGSDYDAGKTRIGKYVSPAYLTRKGIDGQEPTEYN